MLSPSVAHPVAKVIRLCRSDPDITAVLDGMHVDI
jgi:hypothetical protein